MWPKSFLFCQIVNIDLFSAKFSSIQFLGNESRNWASVTLELYLAKNQKPEKRVLGTIERLKTHNHGPEIRLFFHLSELKKITNLLLNYSKPNTKMM